MVCVLVSVVSGLVCALVASGGSPEGPRNDPWTITNALIGEQVHSTIGVTDNPASFPSPGKEVEDCLGMLRASWSVRKRFILVRTST